MTTTNFSRTRPTAVYIVVPLVMVLLLGVWIIANLRSGSLVVNPEGVSHVILTRPAHGERNVMPNTFISADLNPGYAIDPHTLSPRSVRLYRATDREMVAGIVTTSAAGDTIIFQPVEPLDPGTQYTFEVTRDLRDTTGGEFFPYHMSFTTGGGAPLQHYPVAFEKIEFPSDSERYTALAVGPDRKLYTATADGKIVRREILHDGSLGRRDLLLTVHKHNEGPRLITGICFDPRSTAENLKLWISHGQVVFNDRGEFSLEGASDWTGKISVASGPDLDSYRDVIINLPRSWRDHLNNQLDFGPDGALYFSQASHTAMGAPDRKWAFRSERLLSAAILRVDVSRISEPLDVKTDEGGTYDPFAPDAPLTIYASGVRVGYDVLWHSNGNLYTAVNGSSAGGNTPGTPSGHVPRRIDQERFGPYTGPSVPALNGVSESQDDVLLRVERGRYYGHPNPTRGEYVINGGNPTSAPDPFEVSAYPVGVRPDRNWHAPVFIFGMHVSPNGLIEYRSKTFDSLLAGKILVTRFSGGKDVLVLSPDEHGNITETISGIAGLGDFTDPLDLVEDIETGVIYIAEFRGEKLSMLHPVTDRRKAASMSNRVFRQEAILPTGR